MSAPQPIESTLVVTGDDVADYLRQMDIDIAAIDDAVAAGEIAAGNVTSFHPVTAAGLSRWIDVVGVLRTRLAEGEWAPDNPQNRPVTKHQRLGYTLSTVGGDEATGIEDHPDGPRAARRKGRATAEAVNGTPRASNS